MKKIENKVYQAERSLYNIKDTKLINVSFSGEEDGESPLKECENIELKKCVFDLRYALWHNSNIVGSDLVFSDKCRAPLWYGKDINISNSKISGVKTFRESSVIALSKVEVNSPEFMWRCSHIDINKSIIEGEYAFFECSDLVINKLEFKGKYSFQYVNGMKITDSKFDTKDAFWHAKNVVVKNSYIKGEYLGWYAENITFINCTIESHQPLCYVKGLKLENCKFVNSDLAFEYSEVDGNIIGHIDSIKNPLSGSLKVDSVGELIREDDKYESKGKVIIGK